VENMGSEDNKNVFHNMLWFRVKPQNRVDDWKQNKQRGKK
jgi:hypothetical protein